MNEFILPNIVGSFQQGQQIVQQRQDAAQQNQLRALQMQQGQMQLQQAQEAQGRDAQFRNQLATYLQGGSDNLAALYQADPERAMQVQQFQVQQNQLAKAQNVEKNKKLYANAEYVLQSKAPKALVETQFPELVAQLRAKGVDSSNFTDDQWRQVAEGVKARAGTEAGIVPEKVSLDKQAELSAADKSREDQQRFEAGQKQLDRSAEEEKAKIAAQATGANKSFQNATDLRKEYDTQSKEFQQATQGYQSVLSASQNPSAAGDLALIFGYMKTLDPGSSVKEGEFANAQNAGSAWSVVGALYNRVRSGERLTAEQRKDFVGKAGELYQGQKDVDDKRRQKYLKIAQRNGLNPQDVLGDQVRVEPPPHLLGIGQTTQMDGFKIKRVK